MIFFFLNCILDGREQTAWKINLMFALELLLSLDWELYGDAFVISFTELGFELSLSVA